MAQGLRVRIAAAEQGDGDHHGTATDVGDGFTVVWDDHYKDEATTRWHFEGDGIFNLEEVK